MNITEVILQNSDELIIIIDDSGVLVDMNPVAEGVFGLSKSQLTDLNFFTTCKQIGVNISS